MEFNPNFAYKNFIHSICCCTFFQNDEGFQPYSTNPQLTNSMEMSITWQAASHSAIQEKPPRFIIVFTRALVHILSQMNSVHTAPFYFS
jgi:hypothetical protein